jgi:ribonuclease P protein subunit RPR2
LWLALAVAACAVLGTAVALRRVDRSDAARKAGVRPAGTTAVSANGAVAETTATESSMDTATAGDRLGPKGAPLPASPFRRLLVVDDDAALRLLLRTTLAADEFEVEEASGAAEAAALSRFRRPDAVILDVGLLDGNGLEICRELKQPANGEPPTVILLTGADTNEREAVDAGADALLRKPFSPLELLDLLDRLAAGSDGPFHEPPKDDAGQLLLYARDLNRLLQVERTQRRLLQQAYRQTTSALADALEAKDRRTGTHALRVQRYAVEITEEVDRTLLEDPSLEYGFLLHDIGKIAIPDAILNKPGPLAQRERELVKHHPMIGVEILQEVALLQGEGLSVVGSHHERWDGRGYPEGRSGSDIPLGARIFALADTLDAMTTDRPYRAALSWGEAVDEILGQNGRQFDPGVVSAFAGREPRLRRLYEEFVEASPADSSSVRPNRLRVRGRASSDRRGRL